jgi:hypothetical protein
MLFTVIVLWIAKAASVVSFPNTNLTNIGKAFPLPFLFLGNMLTGLIGTKRTNLPMFTVLRRFALLFTMIGEYWLLGVQSSRAIQVSVALMIVGAIIAAYDDLAFDATGYFYTTLNNLFTAAYGIYLKRSLDSKELGTYGLMQYNSIASMPLLVMLIYCLPNEMEKALSYPLWMDPTFLVAFCLCGALGFILTYSLFWCTDVNSALTASVIGCLKNVFVSYFGILLGLDYIFSWTNFVGLNISIFGSLVYAYVKYREMQTNQAQLEVVKVST